MIYFLHIGWSNLTLTCASEVQQMDWLTAAQTPLRRTWAPPRPSPRSVHRAAPFALGSNWCCRIRVLSPRFHPIGSLSRHTQEPEWLKAGIWAESLGAYRDAGCHRGIREWWALKGVTNTNGYYSTYPCPLLVIARIREEKNSRWRKLLSVCAW